MKCWIIQSVLERGYLLGNYGGIQGANTKDIWFNKMITIF